MLKKIFINKIVDNSHKWAITFGTPLFINGNESFIEIDEETAKEIMSLQNQETEDIPGFENTIETLNKLSI
jgi:hypothetical protein